MTIVFFVPLQLPHDALVPTLPLLVALLNAESMVVHSYASHAIEKLFMIKTSEGKGL